MKSLEIKRQLLKDGSFELFSKSIYVNYLYLKLQISYLDEEESKFLNENMQFHLDCDAKDYFNEEQFKALRQLYDAHRQRVFRTKKKIKKFFRNFSNVYFITLTFNDETLEKTNAETRRTYVTRFLSSLNYGDYIANIDYGSKNFREHYHVVLGTYEDFPKNLNWNYGFSYCELVGSSNNDFGKLSHYCNKLTFHSLKESTGLGRSICPKNTHYNFLPFKE